MPRRSATSVGDRQRLSRPSVISASGLSSASHASQHQGRLSRPRGRVRLQLRRFSDDVGRCPLTPRAWWRAPRIGSGPGRSSMAGDAPGIPRPTPATRERSGAQSQYGQGHRIAPTGPAPMKRVSSTPGRAPGAFAEFPFGSGLARESRPTGNALARAEDRRRRTPAAPKRRRKPGQHYRSWKT